MSSEPELPKGCERFERPDGIPVKVDVEVDTQAAIIVVDLTDNPDCQPCGLNSPSRPPSALRWWEFITGYSIIMCGQTPAASGASR